MSRRATLALLLTVATGAYLLVLNGNGEPIEITVAGDGA